MLDVVTAVDAVEAMTSEPERTPIAEEIDMSEQQSGPNHETYKVSGQQLVDKVKELLHEGNVRRVKITHEGRTVFEIPLTVAAVGVLIAPMLAALGAFAALATECTIEVEREPMPPVTR